MPLFRFHESQGLPHGHLDWGTGRYAGLYGDSEPGDFLPPCFMYHGRKEISPLRSASVEMTIGGPPAPSSRAGLRAGMGDRRGAIR